MRIHDLTGSREEVEESIATKIDGENGSGHLVRLLAELVLILRRPRNPEVLCPGCDAPHRRNLPKHYDRRGRIWHSACAGSALGVLYPEKVPAYPVREPGANTVADPNANTVAPDVR